MPKASINGFEFSTPLCSVGIVIEPVREWLMLKSIDEFCADKRKVKCEACVDIDPRCFGSQCLLSFLPSGLRWWGSVSTPRWRTIPTDVHDSTQIENPEVRYISDV